MNGPRVTAVCSGLEKKGSAAAPSLRRVIVRGDKYLTNARARGTNVFLMFSKVAMGGSLKFRP